MGAQAAAPTLALLWAGGRSASPASLEFQGPSPPAAALGPVLAAVGLPPLPTGAAGKRIAAHSTWAKVGVLPGAFLPFAWAGNTLPGPRPLGPALGRSLAPQSRLLLLLGENLDLSGARTPGQAATRGRLVLFIKHHVVNHHQNVTMIKMPSSGTRSGRQRRCPDPVGQ